MKTSKRIRVLLDTLEKEDARRLKPFIHDFERSCILSDFDEALKVLPFDVDCIKEDLLIIFNHVRQRVVARLGERLLVDAVYNKGSSGSASASKIMEQIMPQENPLAGLNGQPFIALIASGGNNQESNHKTIDITPEVYDG